MSRNQALFIGATFLALYVAAIAFRPILAIDETRYLSVAWEMYLRQDWLAPLTVNFEPYHHKPPLLFWLINLSWAVFGVSRWAATIPVTLMAAASVILAVLLCRRLAPELVQRTTLIMLGSFPLLIYSTLILFDLTVTVFVLAALIGLHEYARTGRRWLIPAIGLSLGLGVLTKGPVTYLYVLFPMLFGPLWIGRRDGHRGWYAGAFAALLVSLIPVGAWLIPVLGQSSGEFAYWLVWEQTAGRITGGYEGGHPRPAYFYIPVVLLMCLPWLLFPQFWTGWTSFADALRRDTGMRFLLIWLAPTLVAFSLIGGKQPHYLLPLLPGLAILVARQLQNVSENVLRGGAVSMIALVLLLHAWMPRSETLAAYDLAPLAELVSEHDGDVAYVRVYRGEISYLARLEEPLQVVSQDDIPGWFEAHPDGIAVISNRSADRLADFEVRYSARFRNKQISIIAPRSEAGRATPAAAGQE